MFVHETEKEDHKSKELPVSFQQMKSEKKKIVSVART